MRCQDQERLGMVEFGACKLQKVKGKGSFFCSESVNLNVAECFFRVCVDLKIGA